MTILYLIDFTFPLIVKLTNKSTAGKWKHFHINKVFQFNGLCCSNDFLRVKACFCQRIQATIF